MTQSLTGVKLRTKIPVFYISDKINLITRTELVVRRKLRTLRDLLLRR